MKIIRSILAIVVGLLVITIVAEGIEYFIVAVIMDVPSDVNNPAPYFTARNQPLILVLKHLYNGLAGLAAGYLLAKIAGYKEKMHGWILIFVQTIAIIWTLTQPDMAKWLPIWLWITITVATLGGVYGGVLVGRNKKQSLT